MPEADPAIRAPKAQVALGPAFAVRLASILKVRPFVSGEETRYYLNGVYVDTCLKGGAVCVATDGHRLAVQRDPDGLSIKPVIVRLPAEIKLPPRAEFKKTPRGPWLVCLEGEGRGHISIVPAVVGRSEDDTPESAIERVEEAVLRVGSAVIDGKFPDWQRVIPKLAETAITRSFNPQYIKDFGSTMTLTGDDASAPHLVRTGDQNFIGVLMPMRVIEQPAPDWLTAA